MSKRTAAPPAKVQRKLALQLGDLTWAALNANLKSYTQPQVWELLEHEFSNKKRLNFLLRLHGRFNVLRAKQERMDLLNLIKLPEH